MIHLAEDELRVSYFKTTFVEKSIHGHRILDLYRKFNLEILGCKNLELACQREADINDDNLMLLFQTVYLNYSYIIWFNEFYS